MGTSLSCHSASLPHVASGEVVPRERGLGLSVQLLKTRAALCSKARNEHLCGTMGDEALEQNYCPAGFGENRER